MPDMETSDREQKLFCLRCHNRLKTICCIFCDIFVVRLSNVVHMLRYSASRFDSVCGAIILTANRIASVRGAVDHLYSTVIYALCTPQNICMRFDIPQADLILFTVRLFLSQTESLPLAVL